MVEVKRGIDSEEVRQSAKYTLFVEGRSENAIDPQVLGYLLREVPIQIKALGPSSHIRSAAEALHKHHPYYFFLIDRDHHDEQYVQKCWESFPDSSHCNLLIWKRRELENYFLMPDYLWKSSYKHCTFSELQDCILETARRRIFLDAANIVIVTLREKLKRNWIEIFSNVNEFATKELALKELLARDHFRDKKHETAEMLNPNAVAQMFEDEVATLFGGQNSLDFEHGSWLAMISGKETLPTVINRCFRVRIEDHGVQGRESLMEVVRSLLKLGLEVQPEDFRELQRLISEQVK